MVRSIIILLFLSALSPTFFLSSATAQTRAEINAKIDALEKQLRAVQRQVFNSESPYFDDTGTSNTQSSRPSDTAAASGATPAASPALLADLSLKVDAVERQLRALTGQIEELQYENRRLKDRLGRFEQDVTLRLRELENGRAAPSQLSDARRPLSGNAAGETETSGPTTERSGLVSTPTPESADALLDDPSSNPAPAFDPNADPEDLYDQAYSLLRRGQVENAESAFRAFLDRHRSHALAGNAQYWLGETFYARQNYARAAQAFLTGYQDFGDGAKAADSLLKLGVTLAALGQNEDACAAFDELDDRYPETEERIKRRLATERSRLNCQ